MKAVYAGSFDPLTLGHIDIITRAAEMFDHLTVAIGINPQKKTLFSEEERLGMLKHYCTANYYSDGVNIKETVAVSSFQGLLVEYAKSIKAKYLVRGIRNAVDFEFESQLAQVNKKIAPNIETVFLLTNPELSVVSSSAVKEIAHYGGDIKGFVTGVVAKKINEKFGFLKAGVPENK
jgi:pantetheine-phosphate adenylyltransferase